MSFETYKKTMIKDIKECLDTMKSQPIIFIGSGFSRRYFDAPDWLGLLEEVGKECPLITHEFEYYKQKYNKNGVEIADSFVDFFYEWAWGKGKLNFDKELFENDNRSDIYLKSAVSKHLESLVPSKINDIKDEFLKKELKIIKKIIPHAIITTNYDSFLEKIFPDYTPIIGQQVLKNNYSSIGEILKIHGCTKEASSLVLVDKDYREFKDKKKYLSAKLFTYFAEHPLIFIGYSAKDPNIKAILSDIDELLSDKNEIIPNIYIVNWKKEINEGDYFEQVKTISLENEKEIKIKNITTSSYEWIFEAFSSKHEISNINIKTLRSLMARVHKLVRTDIPNSPIEINYQTLESAIETEEGIPKLLGITMIDDPSDMNKCYPYTLTQIGIKLGFTNWHGANKLIEKITKEKCIDIKCSDNRYHVAIKTGNTSKTNKYSEKCFNLLDKVKDGKEYKIDHI